MSRLTARSSRLGELEELSLCDVQYEDHEFTRKEACIMMKKKTSRNQKKLDKRHSFFTSILMIDLLPRVLVLLYLAGISLIITLDSSPEPSKSLQKETKVINQKSVVSKKQNFNLGSREFSRGIIYILRC